MFSCYCRRQFKDQSALEQHQRSTAHCYCRECDRFFGHTDAVEQHRLALHDFTCSDCDRTFLRTEALRQHQNSKKHGQFRGTYRKNEWGSRINFQLSYGLKPCRSLKLSAPQLLSQCKVPHLIVIQAIMMTGRKAGEFSTGWPKSTSNVRLH